MKSFSSILTLGAMLAIAGNVVAAPVPDAAAAPVPARETVTYWQTVTHVKVVGVTKTHWVDPPTSTPTTEATTTTTSTTEEETTTTTTPTTTTTTTSTTEEETTTTTTPTTSTTTTTTTEEETTTTTSTTPTSTTTTSTTTSTPPPEPTTTSEIPPTTSTTIIASTSTIQVEVTIETPEPQADSGSEEWEGDATYFDPGMGSCGYTNGPSDMIAAISYQVMDPQNPGNPNNNPLCGKMIRCTRNGKNPTIIKVVDRCPVCAHGDLDLSPAAYAALGGTIAEGRFKIQCSWV